MMSDSPLAFTSFDESCRCSGVAASAFVIGPPIWNERDGEALPRPGVVGAVLPAAVGPPGRRLFARCRRSCVVGVSAPLRMVAGGG